MIDTVSKNGTFILNVPGKPDGTIDSKEIAVLDGITSWMQVNGEAIYETRPWKIYGEGPNRVRAGYVPGQQHQQARPQGHSIHQEQGEYGDLCHCAWLAVGTDPREGAWNIGANKSGQNRAGGTDWDRREGKVETVT